MPMMAILKLSLADQQQRGDCFVYGQFRMSSGLKRGNLCLLPPFGQYKVNLVPVQFEQRDARSAERLD